MEVASRAGVGSAMVPSEWLLINARRVLDVATSSEVVIRDCGGQVGVVWGRVGIVLGHKS
jgi:hypothetical protein